MREGADCGSDHELFFAKLRLKLKKVGENLRPFGYELNQFTYNYIVSVRNRFKGLDLIECLRNYGRDIVQEVGIKTPKKNKCKKAKWLSEETLQIAEKRKVKDKGKKERYTYLNSVPMNSK